jgi:hypothetical protein
MREVENQMHLSISVVVLRNLLVVLALGAVAGCATVPTQLEATSPQTDAPGLGLEDQRPAIQARGGTPRLFDPLYVFGDKMFDLSPPEVLRQKLWQEFGNALAGDVLVIHAFAVENYYAATFRRNQAAGLLGAGQTAAGFMAMREAGDTFDAVFVTINATVGGQVIEIQTVEPYTVDNGRISLELSRSTRESIEAAKLAVSRAIDEAVEILRPAKAEASTP